MKSITLLNRDIITKIDFKILYKEVRHLISYYILWLNKL